MRTPRFKIPRLPSLRLPSAGVPAGRLRLPKLRLPAGSFRPGPGGYTRWIFHGTLFTAFATVAGMLLVWPQWTAADSARTALQTQREREQELNEQVDLLRANTQPSLGSKQDGRRVFLAHEVSRYAVIVHALAKQNGVHVDQVRFSNKTSDRWRALAAQRERWDEDQGPVGGEIGPQAVRVVLEGSFENIYRTVAALCQQRQLFIPDRWELAPKGASAPGASDLRCEIWATIFVAREPVRRPPGSGSPLASQLDWEDEG
jgi:hypothetical protein